MFQVICAPTVTGHWTLAVLRPAFAAASHNVGTRISSAYQYQPWIIFLQRIERRIRQDSVFRRPHAGNQRGMTRISHRGYHALNALGVRAFFQKAPQIRHLRAMRIRRCNVVGPQTIDRDHDQQAEALRVSGADCRRAPSNMLPEEAARNDGCTNDLPIFRV